MIMTPATYAAILPLLLILVSFVLKLFVGKSVKEVELLKCFIELPVDISVFCVSTIISLIITIKAGEIVAFTIVVLVVAFLLKIVAIFLWRYCLSNLESKSQGLSFSVKVYFTTMFNLIMTISMGYYSVMLLLGGSNAT